MRLDEKLVFLRKEKRLSQLVVAEKLGVSRQAISRWEVGAATPSTENLKCLGELYGVPVDALLNDSCKWPYPNGTPEAEEPALKKPEIKRATILAIVLIGLILIAYYMSNVVDSKEETPISDLETMQWDVSGADEFLLEW